MDETKTGRLDEQFRCIFSSNVIPMAIWEESGRLVNINKAFLDLVGYTRTELEKNVPYLNKLISPADAESDLQAIVKTQGKGFCRPFEKSFIHKEGHLVPVLIYGGYLNTNKNKSILFAIDLTEHKKTEKAMWESKNIYRIIFETSAEGIIYAEPEGPCLYANQRFADMLGYTVDEIVGKPGTIYTFDNEEPQILEIHKSLNKGDLLHGEYRFRRKDGTELWTLFNATPVFNIDGEHIANFSMYTDITNRKKAEAKIKRQNTILQAINKVYKRATGNKTLHELGQEYLTLIHKLIGSSAELIGRVSKEGSLDNCIYNMGPEVMELPENMAGQMCKEETGPAGPYHSLIIKAESILINDPACHPDSFDTPEGHFKIKSFLGVPFVAEEKVLGFIAVANKEGGFSAEDQELLKSITPGILEVLMRKKVMEELKEANKNKDKYISILSHELRNPLATISAGMDLIDISNSPHQHIKARNIIRRQISQLKKLIDDLMDVSRITQNKIKLRKEDLILNEIIKDAVEDFKTGFEKKGIKLQTRIQKQPIILHADALRIAQVVANLLSNSLKFTQKGGFVWLTLSQKGDKALITIKDNGVGIGQQIIADLFKPFTQAEQGRDRHDGGLGLGLSIVKGITELHGGDIKVYSAGPDKGAEFTVHLPILGKGE